MTKTFRVGMRVEGAAFRPRGSIQTDPNLIENFALDGRLPDSG